MKLAFIDRVLLVPEDAGGEPLHRPLLGSAHEVGRFLRLFIGSAQNALPGGGERPRAGAARNARPGVYQ
jgi:hypothetical protein